MKTLIVFYAATALFYCRVCVGAEEHSKWTPKSKNPPSETAKLDLTNQPLTNETRIETVNELSDVILNSIPPIMNKYNLNPFLAPDQKQSIVPVNLVLKNIKVYNLTTIQRASDLIILDDATNRQLIVSLKLKFDDVILVSDYHAYIRVLPFVPAVGSKGILTAIVPGITVDVKVTVDFKDVNATLDSLKLSTNRNLINVKLTGNLERHVLNIGMPVIVVILQDVILRILQDPLRKQINAAIHEVTGMINGFLSNINQ